MNVKQIIVFVILIIPLLIYILFKDTIKPIWDEFDTIFTISSYSISLVLLLYNLNLKFHFAINRLFQWLKQDHTYWRFSYYIEQESDFDKNLFVNNLKKLNVSINKDYDDFIEFIYNESYLFRIQITRNEIDSINLFSSKIIVPTKRVKSTINEIIEITEVIENSLNLIVTETKRFDLTIEYPKTSPFYSYWIKKLPEQSIYNFNFSIKIPDNENVVSVNKNQLIIKSNSINKLFDTTKDYLSLQIEI